MRNIKIIKPLCKCCEYEIEGDQAYLWGDDWYCEDCEDEFFEIIKKEFFVNCETEE